MDVSICIVNWNTKDLLKTCIRSIKDKTSGLKYEIIVMDNNSSDGSIEMLKTEYPDCKLIASTENLGFARGNNLCVRYALGKYFLFLNPDTELVTNALFGMFETLEKNPIYGAVGCRLIYPSGDIQYTCASTFPTPFKELSFLFLLNRLFPKSAILSARELDYWNHMDSTEIDCLSGACIMARKDVIERIGGFDEKIFMYSEDLDLCYRILKEGFKVYYVSTEVIVHHVGASSSQQKNTHFSTLMQKQSNYYFMRKNYGAVKATIFRTAIFAGSLFRVLIMIPFFLVSSIGLIDHDKDVRLTLEKYILMLLWSIHIKRLPNLD